MTARRLATAITRRQVLWGALALPWAGIAPARARERDLTLALIGQCLVRHDLRRHPWPGFDALAKRLRAQDACFTDLEVALTGPRRGAPTRAADTVHTADPVVLDCLRDFGVTLFATSNNHAFDVGTGGILDTMAALRARGLAFAGTGETLAEASAPAFLADARRPGRAGRGGGRDDPRRRRGDAGRAGVHEIRRGAAGGLDAGDVERMLESLRVAARRAAS
jgi:poly-gamma-glutamate capsule biosynthesis protein CapA/YwtB (metallophosphatase superfamily)